MQKNSDGSFGSITDLRSALEAAESDPDAERVLTGTKEELERLKSEREFLIERFDRLEKKLNALLIHFGLSNRELWEEAITRALLAWKRGEKVWCDHWSWSAQNNAWYARTGSGIYANYVDDSECTWDICPVTGCHAPKPE